MQLSRHLLVWSLGISTAWAIGASAEVTFRFSDPGVNWGVGSTQEDYAAVHGSGVDIRVTVFGDLASIGAGYPAITQDLDDQTALWLRIDSHDNMTQAVTLNVDFFKTGTTIPAPVTGVSAEIFEIDHVDYTDPVDPSHFRDDIREIAGQLQGGGSAPATATANTAGTPSFEIVDNGLSTMRLTGIAGSPESPAVGFDSGDATLSFGAATITGFSYTYGNRLPLLSTDPTLQFTALNSITFTVIPEPSATVLALLGVGLLILRKRLRKPAA